MKKTKKSLENCCEVESCCGDNSHCKCGCHKSGHSCAIYGLGVIGSLFYFLPQVIGLGPSLLAVGKSFFWPALILFKVLTLLQI